MPGGRQGFLKASEDLQRRTYFVASGAHIADEDIASAARMALEGKSPAVVATLPVKLRRDAVCALRGIGLTVGQVARLTGMGARMIVRDSAKGLKDRVSGGADRRWHQTIPSPMRTSGLVAAHHVRIEAGGAPEVHDAAAEALADPLDSNR